MKKWILLTLCILMLLAGGLFAAKTAVEAAVEAVLAQPAQLQITVPPETQPAECPTAAGTTTEAVTEAATEPAAEATTVPTEIPTETTVPVVLTFTPEEEALLLQIGAAERGSTGCTECIALVMRTVLNRVESPRFSSTIKGVICAQDQFTPVMDGTFEEAVPDWYCEQALEMIRQGWDESQGALYYEWCEGESWHSQNLNLLLQHCDTRFYN